MKRFDRKPVDTRAFTCPQCRKLRLIRLPDHIVSLEQRDYKISSDKTVKLFVDICDNCRVKNYKQHFEPKPADVRRIMNAIKTGEQTAEGQSLENLL